MPVLLLSNDVRFVYLLVGYHSAVLSVKVYCCLYNTLVRIVRRTAVVYYSFLLEDSSYVHPGVCYLLLDETLL